jgi:hypothetical protein
MSSTTITITITLPTPAEHVLDNVTELAGGLAELRACVDRLHNAPRRGPVAGAPFLSYKVTDYDNDAAASLIERKLPFLGVF